MKGVYLGENQNHSKTTPNMFAKLQHHHQQSPPPPPPPQFSHHQPHPTFHHPFQPPNAASRDCQTSEEAESPTTPSTATPTTTTIKKETTPHDGASIEVIRRPRGRPPGSKNKAKPPVIITQESEPPMRPYVLELSPNIDIIETVTRFCRKRSIGLCILSGSGSVANVTLRQPSTTSPGATVTFHGRFDILSISATLFPSNIINDSSNDGPSNFTISLAGPQGQVFGGAVVGPLASAGVIYLVSATFTNPCYQRLPLEEDSRNGGAAEGRHHSPPGVSGGGGGGGDSGHPPAEMYSCHLGSDVIWAPTARQPHQQPHQPPQPPQQPPY